MEKCCYSCRCGMYWRRGFRASAAEKEFVWCAGAAFRSFPCYCAQNRELGQLEEMFSNVGAFEINTWLSAWRANFKATAVSSLSHFSSASMMLRTFFPRSLFMPQSQLSIVLSDLVIRGPMIFPAERSNNRLIDMWCETSSFLQTVLVKKQGKKTTCVSPSSYANIASLAKNGSSNPCDADQEKQQ